MSVLEPAVVAAIDDLELAARLVVEGLRSGDHRSPFHGYSAEFSQHRAYRAGDDLKYLDWKLLARTDRLYSRQFRETTNVSTMIVLDASASMAFPAAGVSKFRYAVLVAAALAWLVIDRGDAAGLMTMADGVLTFLPARSGRAHLGALLARLARIAPAGTWAPDRVIARGAELLKRRGLLIVLSDFYDDEDATRREMRRAIARGHDVSMIQALSREEIAFPYTGSVEFEDLESSARRLVAAEFDVAAYRARMTQFLERCRAGAYTDGLDYALMPTDASPSHALRGYLLKRAGQQMRPAAGAGGSR